MACTLCLLGTSKFKMYELNGDFFYFFLSNQAEPSYILSISGNLLITVCLPKTVS
jgi:hypothetical protein